MPHQQQHLIFNFILHPDTGINVVDEHPYKQVNLEHIPTLTKQSRITALAWGTDNTEILIGRIEPVVKVYSIESNDFTETHKANHETVVGAARYNGKLIVGLSNGQIQIDSVDTCLQSGDGMSRFRQCAVERNLVAAGGKERQNNVKIWDLETSECLFRTKNVPNDFLQLEVPIWDTDFRFIDANAIATCSRYGYVRLYDRRQQRRPIGQYTNEKEQISYSCMAQHDQTIFVGTTTGVMRAFDMRKMNQLLHTYKGFSGSISDIDVDETGKFLCSASLDRFVRVHASESTILQYQCYVKSKATRILLRTIAPKLEVLSDAEDDGILHSSDDDDDAIVVEQSDGDEFDEIFNNMPTVE